jgi:hypothetical protein
MKMNGFGEKKMKINYFPIEELKEIYEGFKKIYCEIPAQTMPNNLDLMIKAFELGYDKGIKDFKEKSGEY